MPKERRVALPVADTNFGKPVVPPVLKRRSIGALKVWSWRALDTIELANKRLAGDRKFYDDVQRDFGRQ